MTGIENERNLLTGKKVETFTDDASGQVILVIHVPAAKREDKPIYLNGGLLGRTYDIDAAVAPKTAIAKTADKGKSNAAI